MTSILCLSRAELEPLLTLPVVIDAVKEAYVLQASGEGRLFPLVRERLADDATFRMKTGFIPGTGVLGLKAAGSWKGNRTRGEEAHQATVLPIDPATGKPLALLDGNVITTLRTGAGGGIACDLFAATGARCLAVIGTGVQGRIQTEAVLHVRPGVEEIRCFNPHGVVSERYQSQFAGRARVRVAESVERPWQGPTSSSPPRRRPSPWSSSRTSCRMPT
jgi:ornithine cyclodeaminase